MDDKSRPELILQFGTDDVAKSSAVPNDFHLSNIQKVIERCIEAVLKKAAAHFRPPAPHCATVRLVSKLNTPLGATLIRRKTG